MKNMVDGWYLGVRGQEITQIMALVINRKRSPCSSETEGKRIDVNVSSCICISVR